MNEQHQREEALFDAALQLPPAERGDFLDKACAGDHQLRQRVESLLKSHEKTTGVLEQIPEHKTYLVSVPPSEKPGDLIGRYKLLQQIGEGGCGVVYMAEQQEPVRRRVALKILKLGTIMASRLCDWGDAVDMRCAGAGRQYEQSGHYGRTVAADV